MDNDCIKAIFANIMLLKLYNKNNAPKELEKVADILRDGGIVILPTDTLYAICCHALKERAIERICTLKGLDAKKKSLSIVCNDLSHISEYARVDNWAFKLLKQNLPGPFTFILPASNKLPKIFKNRKEVGIRIPDCNIISEICEMLGEPILTTTIPYQEEDDVEYRTNPELIEERFGSEVDLVVDGGIGSTEPSTIVDCTTDAPEVVRQGKGWLDV